MRFSAASPTDKSTWDRLLQGLCCAKTPVSGLWEAGISVKALSAMESLLFAKYQMFRTVYWHHAVRAATGMYKTHCGDGRGVRAALSG